ncbi:MAG: helix-turn-helix domain-containing protein [Clostridiales bacterium]|jgi:DNA-binding XRE family transcriptional regulator|nr:helix-turn-helix domain-containing protein [Clostridiales bacterium]
MNNQAVEQAKLNLADVKERGEAALGSRWSEVRKNLLTQEERAANAIRVELMSEIIQARNEQGVSQKKLEELSGVRQPVIARMERGHTSPQVDTVIKILAPLGKTLAVVPLETV